ncbi:hypothetical protein [Salimicrobium halophilum]|uniref:Phage XkdN-like tail assembly chaperone protein, TAC n=1 Tax=Salimicrobium halophilum TaxID=86666 RepID=A0A1G8WEU4_9BACI|nr:hypothetical protein [Salimicrobium halophilum]SDJ76215.1 Phage XkdN-like tail assembly chaperone protein, TAC [Salimicrobium halophilum]
MSEEKKKVSVQDLIKQKDDIEKKKKETFKIYVPSLDGYVETKKATRSQIITGTQMSEQGEGYEGDHYLIYHCLVDPSLKDDELLKTYGVGKNKGHEIVSKIFEWYEVSMLAQKIAGGDKMSLVDEVKNS